MEFLMPNGKILHKARDVDRFYGLNLGTTSARMNIGWTIEECSSNNRIIGGKYLFEMPDGLVLTKCTDVDRFHSLKKGTTVRRIQRGWSTEECVRNCRKGRHRFNMPDGSILDVYSDVDRYHNLKEGTTSKRLTVCHWSPDECANNKRDKE